MTASRWSELRRLTSSLGALAFLASIASANEPAADYEQSIKPLLRAHCLDCHSAKVKKGGVDLERFTTLESVRKDLRAWKNAIDRIDRGEMPPEKGPHKPLGTDDRKRLLTWGRGVIDAAVRDAKGDPGPAIVRRLSNEEYDNTVRDITGVDLRPAREFPAGGAGGEGFTNASEALEISPELLAKFFAAGKQIANRAVLLPDRVRFSSSPFQQDWVDEIAAELTAFYTQRTVKGTIPLDRYVDALLRNRTALKDGKTTLSVVARQEQLSVRYLESLWGLLQDKPGGNLFLSRLRNEWQQVKSPDAAQIVSRVESWKTALWKDHQPTLPKFGFGTQKFELVSNNFKPPEVIFYIGARAFTKEDRTLIRWENARFEAPGKPPVMLRDMLVQAGYEKLPVEVPPPEPRATDVTRNRDGIIVGAPWVPRITLDRFGRHPLGKPLDKSSFVTSGTEVLAVRLPSALIGAEDNTKGGTITGLTFAIDATLDPESSPEAVVQINVQPYRVRDELLNPLLTANGGPTYFATSKGVAADKLMKDAAEFRAMFPTTVCLTNVSATGGADRVHKEDEAFIRLLLSPAEVKEYERMWDEMSFVSRDAIRRLDSLNAFAKGESPELEGRRKEFESVAANLRTQLVAAEPKQLQAVLALAESAYRRPLLDTERKRLQDLYQELRDRKIPHDEAMKAVIARIFVSPQFLYRLEHAPAGKVAAPLSNWEIATRLSYFLYGSVPDEELREVAASGKLGDPAVLSAQAMRMLKDPRARGLAVAFGTQWLGVRGFDEFQGRDAKLFPTFTPAVRGAAYEETIAFIQDLFKSDLSVMQLIDADHTFLNETLAAYYGIPNVKGAEFRRVNGVRQYGRGGILGQASVLTKHSGASRTSPVLRGIWVLENLLGEKLPVPPKGVPQLPESEDATGQTVRQMVENHVKVETCAVCHRRIDPLGFALENFDTVGRWRTKDMAGRPIDANAKSPDGKEFVGVTGLRTHILSHRKRDFQQQFCRKLLGYALGRAVRITEQPLLDEMVSALDKPDGRVSAAVLVLVQSPQFRMARGAEVVADD